MIGNSHITNVVCNEKTMLDKIDAYKNWVGSQAIDKENLQWWELI